VLPPLLVAFFDGIDAFPEEDHGVLENSKQIHFLSFFFLVVLGLELRATNLLGRHSNTQISFLAVDTHVPGDNFPNSNF
jgi:hypothetical protein